jgi:hypothetical protein
MYCLLLAQEPCTSLRVSHRRRLSNEHDPQAKGNDAGGGVGRAGWHLHSCRCTELSVHGDLEQ